MSNLTDTQPAGPGLPQFARGSGGPFTLYIGVGYVHVAMYMYVVAIVTILICEVHVNAFHSGVY